jgi:translation elongation factor EF-Ts
VKQILARRFCRFSEQCKLLQIDISVVSPDDISESAKEEVRQFESGKKIYKINPKIRNKIVEGRMKSLKKQVLLDQEYIRDPNITVDEYIKQVVGF